MHGIASLQLEEGYVLVLLPVLRVFLKPNELALSSLLFCSSLLFVVVVVLHIRISFYSLTLHVLPSGEIRLVDSYSYTT